MVRFIGATSKRIKVKGKAKAQRLKGTEVKRHNRFEVCGLYANKTADA
jgi:hypothetical protein